MELFAAKDADDPDKEQPVDLKEEPEITKPPAAQVSPTAVPVVFEVSPEAGTGIWTSSGSNWMFLVNGTPHTGWLTDTDGKRYFFNKDGIMQTGWWMTAENDISWIWTGSCRLVLSQPRVKAMNFLKTDL